MTQNETVTVSTGEQAILQWLRGYLQFKGRGAKTEVAEALGITPSGLSKILERGSGFDEKTIKIMSFIMTTKDEHYKHMMPTTGEQIGGLVYFNRRDAEGRHVITWQPATTPPQGSGIDDTLESIDES